MIKRVLSICLVVATLVGIVSIAPVRVRAASDLKISEELFAFVKAWEGFRLTCHYDKSQYTVGYGTRCTKDHSTGEFHDITQEDAEAALRAALASYETRVNSFIDKHGLTYTQGQFDAVVSLIFNCGYSWLNKGQTLISAIANPNATDNEVIFALSVYSMSGGARSAGHVKRRLTEANIFLNGIYQRNPPANYRYVLFDACGGEIVEYNVQGYDANQPVAPFTTAVYEGYTFLGWYTEKNGGTKVEVLDDTLTTGKWLYAHWAEKGQEPPATEPSTEPSTEATQPGEQPSEPQPTGCQHNYGVTVTTPATCTEKGVATHTCSQCGDSHTTEIPATGHQYQNATCTTPKTCTACGLTEGTAPGHQYQDATCLEPKTCTVCGSKEGTPRGHLYLGASCTAPKTCERCGLTEGEPLAHTFKEATCTAPKTCLSCGLTEGTPVAHSYGQDQKCQYCGASAVVCQHDYQQTGVKDATCTEKGSTTYTCTKCQHTYSTNIDPKGHQYQNATCTESKTCSVCGAKDGAALGHSYKNATCTEPKTCSVCNHKEGSAAGHQYQNATCLEPKTCSVCGSKEGTAKGHSYKPATCTEPKTCTVCNHAEGTALGHQYKDATCTEPKTCSVCGSKEGTAKGHSYKAATCTAPKTCTVCNHTEGTALGHQYKDATCTEPKTCTRCQGKEGTALGHNYDASGKCTRCKAEDPEAQKGVQITVTGTGVNVRSGPGTDHKVISSATKGDKLMITETASGSGYLWGKFNGGWICLQYTNYDAVKEDEEPEKPQIIEGTVKASSLNIRENPGTAYKVVGRYANGTKVQILETKLVGTVTWGKTDKGWVSMDYIVQNQTEPEKPTPQPPEVEPEKPAETWTGTVKVSDFLWVRSGAGTEHSAVGKLTNGTKVTVLEKKTVGKRTWGRTQQGWICLDYVVMDEAEKPNEPNTGTKPAETWTGTVKVNDLLHIRSGAGTNHSIVGYLLNGAKVTVLEKKTVSGRVWGRIEKGWICLDYVKLDGQNSETGNTGNTGNTGSAQAPVVTMTVNTTSLRIRKATNVFSTIVGYLSYGQKVEILEKKTVNGAEWGRIEQGWVSMQYLK